MKNIIIARCRSVGGSGNVSFGIDRSLINKTLFVVVFILLLGFQAQAANWYVDNVATGANNGTSWAAAWKSFSAVVWGSSGVKAGDTLYISGGSSSRASSWA